MTTDRRLNLVLLWHMHQPTYRDPETGRYAHPWTYLHAIKDYTDMAAHLEHAPAARAVFNFSPVLLEQLDDYERRLNRFRQSAEPVNDPLLDGLAAETFPAAEEERRALIRVCLRANRKHMIERFEGYRRLVRVAESLAADQGAGLHYLGDQFLADLVTWYHLAWLGDFTRESNAEVKRLMAQGNRFTPQQRRGLLALVGGEIAGLRTRYRKLADAGRIELAMSPYAHPILPLLLDLGSTREATPDADLPFISEYPGGRERARWHIQQGLQAFERFFGGRPAGCWPSEGSISADSLMLLADAGFRWIASGESVLRNSVRASGGNADDPDVPCTPWALRGASLRLFARNDALSDRIGFTYADWHGDDAVGDFIHRVEQIGRHSKLKSTPVVSVILDGENAWEYYPRNGFYFLSALYKRLGDHPFIRLRTYSELLDAAPARELTHVVAGSWVYGTLSTWIGSADKNRAWDMLGDAKIAVDACLARGTLDADAVQAIEHQLAICEASDWFWWLGDYNPAAAVSDFERQYRANLTRLHRMVGSDPPSYLTQVLSTGKGEPEHGGVMRVTTPGQAPGHGS
jgi:alpha-amylase/alpha-mannosidase (GH57 family)